MKRIVTILAATATALAIGLLSPTVAHAQSGGGCKTTSRASSCSSYSNSFGRQSGDFYMNSIGTECTAQLWMYTSTLSPTWKYQYTVVIDHLGRYPESHRYTTATGWGYTEVDFYDCGAHFLYSAISPNIYFP